MALSLYLIYLFTQEAVPRDASAIHAVSAVYSDSPTPPSEYAEWQQLLLPDDDFRNPHHKRYKWYRFELPAMEAETRPWALYLSHVVRPAAIFVNGRLAFDPHLETLSIPRVRDDVQLIRLDHHDLPVGRQHTVMLRNEYNQSHSLLMGAMYVGSETALQNAYFGTLFIKTNLVRQLVFAMVLSSLFVLVLWSFRRADKVYLYYCVAVLFWAVYSYGHIPLDIPISAQSWEVIRLASVFWWPIIVALFCNRFLDDPQPRIERIIIGIAIVTTIVLMLLDEDRLYFAGDYIAPSWAYLFGFYPSYRMLSETFRRRDPQLTWLTICGMQVMLLSLHDILILGHWIPVWPGLWLHYAALLLVLVFSLILIKRFAGSINEAELLNKTLESRIQHKTLELEQNYQRVLELENERNIALERNRFMRDMHDGVGGALVSMRAALEKGNWNKKDVLDGLGEAVEDLYMMIHSLNPYGDDIAQALGSIRHRLESRLQQAGIKLKWQIDELPPVAELGPQIVLQVMRIMQESVTNIIKHAQASQAKIRISGPGAEDDKHQISISIEDNGVGIEQIQNSTTGHGLASMQQRADQIQAQLVISPTNPGTRVLLQLTADTFTAS